MVRGLMGALAHYDANAKPQTPWAQRAMRAHNVSIQAFAAFAPLAVIAMMKIPADGYAGIMAMTFFAGIFAHYIIYCLGIPVLRTLGLRTGRAVIGWISPAFTRYFLMSYT